MKTLEPWVPHPVSAMRYWVHHILPLVYDDSLSYYEVLAKVSAKMNEVIENLNDMDGQLKEMTDFINENFEELRNDFETFKEYMEGKQDAFEEEMKQMQKAFEELITGQFDAFKQTMVEMQEAFEAKLTKQQQDFENEITEQQSNFESTLTQKEQQFETKITEQQNAFEQTLTEKENTFEQSMDTKYQTFVSTVTSQLTEYQRLWEAYKDEIDGKISDFEGEVNTNFSQLQSTLEASIQQWETETEGKLDTKFNEYKTNADGDIANWEADAEEQLNTQFGTLSAEVMQKLADMIVQETGEQTDKVPSQKAWTDRAFIARTFPSVGDDYDFASQIYPVGFYSLPPAAQTTNWQNYPEELKSHNAQMVSFGGNNYGASVLIWTASGDNLVYYVWFDPSSGGKQEYKLYPQEAGSSVNVVQTQGNSETDVMSQKAVTEGLPKFVKALENNDDVSLQTTPGFYRIPQGINPKNAPMFGRATTTELADYERYVYCIYNDASSHKGLFLATIDGTFEPDGTLNIFSPTVMVGSWDTNRRGVSYVFNWQSTKNWNHILPFSSPNIYDTISAWGVDELTATDRGELSSISMTETTAPDWNADSIAPNAPKFKPGLYTIKAKYVSSYLLSPYPPGANRNYDLLIMVLNAGIKLPDSTSQTLPDVMTEHELILAVQVEVGKMWFGVKNGVSFSWAEMPDTKWLENNVSMFREVAATLVLTENGVKPGLYTIAADTVNQDITPPLPNVTLGESAYVCVLNTPINRSGASTIGYTAIALQPKSEKVWFGVGYSSIESFKWIAMGGDSDNPWNSSRTLATSLIQANTNTASDSRVVAENVLSRTLPMFRPPNVVQWGRLHPFTDLQIPAGSYLVDKATFDTIPDKPSGAFSTMSEGNLLITYTTATCGYQPAVNVSNPQYAHVIITAADGESNEVWIGTIKRATTTEASKASWIKLSHE